MDRDPPRGLFLILIAFGFIILLSNLTRPVRVFHEAFLRIVFPVTRAIDYPGVYAVRITERSRRALELDERILRKSSEIAALRQKMGDYRYLKERFGEFYAASASESALPGNFIKARVFIISPEEYFTEFKISRGAADGVTKDAAVALFDGEEWVLAGRISEVYENSSRVLLITSSEFRCAVETGKGYRGVLRGTGGWALRMEYISPGAEISPGDTVYTSGTGGIFPSGLVAGEVVSVETLDLSMGQRAGVRGRFYPQDAAMVYVSR